MGLLAGLLAPSLKNGFGRAAGAIAGVVLERHLAEVCATRGITLKKANPTLAELNEALKGSGAIDIPQWRFNQHLADVRNLCDHAKSKDPTTEQVEELIEGVRKVTKTVF